VESALTRPCRCRAEAGSQALRPFFSGLPQRLLTADWPSTARVLTPHLHLSVRRPGTGDLRPRRAGRQEPGTPYLTQRRTVPWNRRGTQGQAIPSHPASHPFLNTSQATSLCPPQTRLLSFLSLIPAIPLFLTFFPFFFLLSISQCNRRHLEQEFGCARIRRGTRKRRIISQQAFHSRLRITTSSTTTVWMR
jgi:hypothetical protein